MSEFGKYWAASIDRSDTVRERVWRRVYGSEYPEGVDPFSYVTVSELGRFVAESGLSREELLFDVGCGGGGPSLHVADRTGARLLGLDISATAVDEARRRAAAQGMADRSFFFIGEFQRIGLDRASVNAVMSVDALTFAQDKAAALEEIARVLVPGGRLIFTSWDYRATPPDRPPQVPDHRPLLERAGFEVLAYDETAHWRERWRATNLGMIAEKDALVTELGADVAAARVERLRRQLVEQVPLAIHRVLVAAHRL